MHPASGMKIPQFARSSSSVRTDVCHGSAFAPLRYTHVSVLGSTAFTAAMLATMSSSAVIGVVAAQAVLSPFQSRSIRPNLAAQIGSTRPVELQIIIADERFIDHDCFPSGHCTWPGTTCCAAAAEAEAAAHATRRSSCCIPCLRGAHHV